MFDVRLCSDYGDSLMEKHRGNSVSPAFTHLLGFDPSSKQLDSPEEATQPLRASISPWEGGVEMPS